MIFTRILGTIDCLLANTRHDVSSADYVVHEAIGIELALQLHKEQSSMSRPVSNEDFFESLQPFYCADDHPGTVTVS